MAKDIAQVLNLDGPLMNLLVEVKSLSKACRTPEKLAEVTASRAWQLAE
jgi:hypothetical protein